MSSLLVRRPLPLTGTPAQPASPAVLNVTLVFEGDSTTLGAGVDASLRAVSSYPAQVVAGLAGVISPTWLNGTHNASEGGDTVTPQMVDEAAGQIDNLFNGASDENILVVWGGVNDIVSESESAAGIYAGLVQWRSDRAAAGWTKQIVGTLPPISNPGYTAGQNVVFNATIVDLNALIMTNTAGFDDVVDVASASGLEDPTDTAIRSDGTHYTAAGYAIVAAAFLPTIAAYV